MFQYHIPRDLGGYLGGGGLSTSHAVMRVFTAPISAYIG